MEELTENYNNFLRLMGCESSTETAFIYDERRQEDEKKNTISTYPSI
jgi:hypothetical protein